MGYELCAKCGKYHFDDEKCKAIYKACRIEKEEAIPENIDDFEWKEVRAYSFNEAAEEYAKWIDQDHELINEDEYCIVENMYGIRKKFRISAEVMIDYYSEELN